MPHILHRSIAVLVCGLLVLQVGFARQDPAPLGLRIVVVSGAGAEQTVNRIAEEPFEVTVLDRDGILIPGARVVFTAPEMGPGGRFTSGSNVFEATTDGAGRAAAGRYRSNAAAGMYVIRVRAEFAGETATATIPQTNVRRSRTGLLITVLSIGAAVGAALAFGRGEGGESGGPPAPGSAIAPASETPASSGAGAAAGGRPPDDGPAIRFGGSAVEPPL